MVNDEHGSYNVVDQSDANKNIYISQSIKWKRHYPNEPEKWGELLSPKAICEAKNITFKNITFKGEKMKELDDVMREVHFSINPDYPNATPKGGIGYGEIIKESCSIE